MRIVLKSMRSFSASEQFNPIELTATGDLETSHEECAGGKVVLREGKLQHGPAGIKISCAVCRTSKLIEFSNGVQALRRALILGEESRSEGITFVRKT